MYMAPGDVGEMSEWFKEHAWKVCVRLTAYRGFESLSLRQVLVVSIGPFAAICCEPRQVRKEATVAADSGAEVWLVLAASLFTGSHMSYQVLARKWRPRNFQEMVGQEHVLRMLTNALANQRLHHAYLFTGTRGVGKTTLARILAKCLNCEQGIRSNPCGECHVCQSIDTGRFLDLIEVDAASRTKVEDTRELLDNVQYAPSQGRYKIYLIDEVHMLSGHSFNALLKTLEEPPAHVKFLLATTDPKRLPITILSRCLQFNLKRVPIEQIAQQLQHICQTENISFEAPALDLLADAADGSMRDALSLLDQTIAFCSQNITTLDTRQMLGSIEQDALYRLLDALADQDGKKLLAEIESLSEHAPDFNQALNDFLSILHKTSLAQLVPDVDVPEIIKQFATRFTPEETQLYYQIALIGRRDLPLIPNPRQGFEMVMLRMLAFKPANQESPSAKASPQSNAATTQGKAPIASKPSSQGKISIDSKPSMPERRPIASNQQTTSTISNHSSRQIPDTKSTNRNEQFNSAEVALAGSETPWNALLPKLNLTGLALTLASNCTLIQMNETKIELALAAAHEPMLNKKLIERIEQALVNYLKKPIQLDIKITSKEIQTPAKQQQEEKVARQASATESIKNDSHVQKIMNMFDATIDMASIKAIDPA